MKNDSIKINEWIECIYVYPIIHISAHQISVKPGYNKNKTKQRNTAFKKIKTLNNINDSSLSNRKYYLNLNRIYFNYILNWNFVGYQLISCNRSHLRTVKIHIWTKIQIYIHLWHLKFSKKFKVKEHSFNGWPKRKKKAYYIIKNPGLHIINYFTVQFLPLWTMGRNK